MSARTLQMRRAIRGESLDDWLERQRRIDVIQLAEIDGRGYNIGRDERYEDWILEQEIRAAYGEIVSRKFYEKLMFEQIQDKDLTEIDNFDEYWREKMKYKKNGAAA